MAKTALEALQDAVRDNSPKYDCVQHIERGVECGPECQRLTALWNARVPEHLSHQGDINRYLEMKGEL